MLQLAIFPWIRTCVLPSDLDFDFRFGFLGRAFRSTLSWLNCFCWLLTLKRIYRWLWYTVAVCRIMVCKHASYFMTFSLIYGLVVFCIHIFFNSLFFHSTFAFMLFPTFCSLPLSHCSHRKCLICRIEYLISMFQLLGSSYRYSFILFYFFLLFNNYFHVSLQ